MTINVASKTRKIRGAAKARLTAVAKGWKCRHDAAFAVLHPQVEALKSSPTAEISVSTGILGLVFTGHLGAAAGLFGAWVGSRPLTHAIAAGMACIGTLDEAIEKAVSRLPGATDAEADQKPRTPRRRKRRAKMQARVAAVPAGA